MKQTIVVLGGLGDAFLVASLHAAFCQHHQVEAELVIKSGHAAVVDLFPGVPYRVDDDITFKTEANQHSQRIYPNDLFNSELPFFFAHPCMSRTSIKIDEMPSRPFICQADFFRAVLGLPLTAPMTTAVPPLGDGRPWSVMIVEATTWPDTQPEFYPKLIRALRHRGRMVWVNNKVTPLDKLFARAAATELVIGPQCGLMSIFIAGRFPCRKILATPSIDGGVADYWARETFPYAYVERFTGLDFDVDEYKIGPDHEELIRLILDGADAARGRPHDPAPTTTISVPLTPGDFLDRLAILTVKRSRFNMLRRAAMEREYQRHVEARRRAALPMAVDELFDALVKLHADNFDLLERAVPDAIQKDGMAAATHIAAVRSNKTRVELKQMIDGICRAPYQEVKSYYDH